MVNLPSYIAGHHIARAAIDAQEPAGIVCVCRHSLCKVIGCRTLSR